MLLLAACFWRHGDSLGVAFWRGLFTSVSAFCNAGFALQTDSLIPYQHDPVVLHLVAGLIVAGGLSPAAVWAIPTLVQRRGLVRLQIRLILAASAILLVVGAVAFGAFEWSASLAGLSTWDRVHNSWFQSATARTAGFNSVDLSRSHPATRSLLIVLMFIGGSPGGTAGGVKTTTVALLVLAVAAALSGRAQPTTFRRTIAVGSWLRAAAVATLGAAAATVALVALQLTQQIPFDAVAFEVVSALGTVGLSLGATAQLDAVGKLLVMTVMFVGRVGPLTLFLFLAGRGDRPTIGYPVEDVDTG
jgi:trk system potassium uptake protein TrkH